MNKSSFNLKDNKIAHDLSLTSNNLFILIQNSEILDLHIYNSEVSF